MINENLNELDEIKMISKRIGEVKKEFLDLCLKKN